MAETTGRGARTTQGGFSFPLALDFSSGSLQGSIQQILFQNAGKYVVCEFQTGQNAKEIKSGLLEFVGANYLVLHSNVDQSHVVCDVCALRFATFGLTAQSEAEQQKAEDAQAPKAPPEKQPSAPQAPPQQAPQVAHENTQLRLQQPETQQPEPKQEPQAQQQSQNQQQSQSQQPSPKPSLSPVPPPVGLRPIGGNTQVKAAFNYAKRQGMPRNNPGEARP